jgi:hypothetical protein
MLRAAAMLAVMALVAGCGGVTATPRPTATATATEAGSTAAPRVGASPLSTLTGAEGLCSLLTSEDLGQFNFVTAASPDVSSDGPGTAICQYASGIFLEVYVDDTPEAAEETYQTILENAPFEGGHAVQVLGADEAQVDTEVGDDSAGIAARAGRLSITLSLPPSDTVELQLATLATLVLQRASDLT